MANVDDLARSYTTAVLRATGYRATWLPNETLEVGSVGYIEGGVFQERQHLRDFAVEFDVKGQQAKARFVYQSSKGVTVTFKARGEASDLFERVGKASAGALVEFTRQGAAILSAPSCTISRIADFRKVERQLHRLKDWDGRYVIVTKLVAADTATILVSNSDSSHAELRAAGNLQAGGADLADLSAGFSTAKAHDVGIHIVAQGGLTPLYQAEHFKRSFRDRLTGHGGSMGGVQGAAPQRATVNRTA